jgi:hypothetical protein
MMDTGVDAMTHRASLTATVVVMVAASVLVSVAMSGCRRSSEALLQDAAGRRYCLECGHEWVMSLGAIKEERLQDPTGNRFVCCPKCGQWRGVSMGYCSECGKRIPRRELVEMEDGSIVTQRRSYCDECARKLAEQAPEAIPAE